MAHLSSREPHLILLYAQFCPMAFSTVICFHSMLSITRNYHEIRGQRRTTSFPWTSYPPALEKGDSKAPISPNCLMARHGPEQFSV